MKMVIMIVQTLVQVVNAILKGGLSLVGAGRRIHRG